MGNPSADPHGLSVAQTTYNIYSQLGDPGFADVLMADLQADYDEQNEESE